MYSAKQEKTYQAITIVANPMIKTVQKKTIHPTSIPDAKMIIVPRAAKKRREKTDTDDTINSKIARTGMIQVTAIATSKIAIIGC